MNMVWEWYNVGKTTINRPQFHHFYRWYGYHFQMCGFWHSCSHMNGIWMGILDGKYHHGHFAKGLDINPFSIQKIHDVWICTSFLSGWQKATIFNVNGMWLLEITRSGPVFLSFAVDIATRFGDPVHGFQSQKTYCCVLRGEFSGMIHWPNISSRSSQQPQFQPIQQPYV